TTSTAAAIAPYFCTSLLCSETYSKLCFTSWANLSCLSVLRVCRSTENSGPSSLPEITELPRSRSFREDFLALCTPHCHGDFRAGEADYADRGADGEAVREGRRAAARVEECAAGYRDFDGIDLGGCGAGCRWVAARPRDRDLRAGVVGEDDVG